MRACVCNVSWALLSDVEDMLAGATLRSAVTELNNYVENDLRSQGKRFTVMAVLMLRARVCL